MEIAPSPYHEVYFHIRARGHGDKKVEENKDIDHTVITEIMSPEDNTRLQSILHIRDERPRINSTKRNDTFTICPDNHDGTTDWDEYIYPFQQLRRTRGLVNPATTFDLTILKEGRKCFI